MKKQILLIINEGCALVNYHFANVNCRCEAQEILERISHELTKKVVFDERFIAAIGEKTAKKAKFIISTFETHCDECGSFDITLRICLHIGRKETPFAYDYDMFLTSGVADETISPQVVTYTLDGKTYIFDAFRFSGCGVTSPKTLKNGCATGEVSLEDIYEEIMCENDLVICR